MQSTKQTVKKKHSYAIDLQGFLKPGQDYVLKELAIISLDDEDTEPLVRLFKPPFPWRKLSEKYRQENTWIERYYHGIPWDSGDYEYTEIGFILRSFLGDADKIYVDGKIKKEWLERFKFKVQDVSELNYSSFEKPKLVTVCPNHNGSYKATCALHNVRIMKKFYVNNVRMDWE